MDRPKTINDGMELCGQSWHLRAPGSLLLDCMLLGVFMLVPLACLARHSGQTAEAFPILLLLAGVTLAYMRPADNRWAAALLLDWGFLSHLASLSWEVSLAGLSLSVQMLFLILLVLLVALELCGSQPSRLIVSLSGLAMILFFFVPCSCSWHIRISHD